MRQRKRDPYGPGYIEVVRTEESSEYLTEFERQQQQQQKPVKKTTGGWLDWYLSH